MPRVVNGAPGHGIFEPDAFQVRLHRAHRNAKLPGYCLVRKAIADSGQNLPFSR
jgi:hypothetical protein